MGNSVSRVVGCFVPVGHDRKHVAVFFSDEPLHEGLGHSFCYVRPSLENPSLENPSHSHKFNIPDSITSDHTHKLKFLPETSFKSISGASVSANTSTPRTINCHEQFHSFTNVPDDLAAAFESTPSFTSLPLQPIPRSVTFSGPISGTFSGPISGPLEPCNFMSGPIERGIMSGPLERGFLSGPLERGCMSGPIEFSSDRNHFSAPLAGNYSLYIRRRRTTIAKLIGSVGKPVKRVLRRTLSKTSSTVARTQRSLKQFVLKHARKDATIVDDSHIDSGYTSSDVDSKESHNIQWAQGKAGEDRVHVVLSERHGWLFVGIYDGFNGPDAPDFLMRNLYTQISRELRGLLWDRNEDSGELKKPEGEDGAALNADVHSRNCESSLLMNDEHEPHSSSLRKIAQTNVSELDSSSKREECKLMHSRKDVGVIDLSVNEQYSGRPERLIDENRLKQTDAHPSTEIAEKFEQEVLLVDQNTCVRCSDVDADALSDIAADKTSPHVEGKSDALGKKAQFLGTAHMMQNLSPDRNLNNARPQVNRKPWKGKFFLRPKFWHRHSRNKENHGTSSTWRYDWEQCGEESDESKVQESKHMEFKQSKSSAVDHSAVLEALARALELTEKAYLEMCDQALEENPELALMGSCILVMLMKGEDVYVMNVGDSRAIVAQNRAYDHQPSSPENSQSLHSNNANGAEKIGARDSLLCVDLERIIEETPIELEAFEAPYSTTNIGLPISSLSLNAMQLSTDHSTSIEGEINRIKSEHPDDNLSILNERVKGRLKVTRAFGAGFLKKPRWNNAILEMFRIDYVGSDPYISCMPALCHHRLGPNDHFLILSSDGLYQYLSNQEVVSHVQWFMEKFPEGDPAQHLIEELLFRAAKKAGMDFHELLDIPQGDRRKYHDDVSVMVISLEGRMWRSCG